MEEYDYELQAELRKIESIHLVSSVSLQGKLTDKDFNSVRVRAVLKGEFVEQKSRRRVQVACSKCKPTPLDAARELREKILKEFASELLAADASGSASVAGMGASVAATSLVAAELTNAPMGTSASGASSGSPSTSLFDSMKAGSLAQRSLERAIQVANEEVKKLREQEKQIIAARILAENKEAEARANLRRLLPQPPSHKKQRRAFAATSSSSPDTSPCYGLEVDKSTGSADGSECNDRYWDSWNLAEFRRQELILAKRRRVQLSSKEGRLPMEMPRGKRDGPLDHDRFGLVGALQYWAAGSEKDAVKIIAALIARLELTVPSAEAL